MLTKSQFFGSPTPPPLVNVVCEYPLSVRISSTSMEFMIMIISSVMISSVMS